LLQQRLNIVVSECVGTKLHPEQLQQMVRRLNSTLSDSDIDGAIAGMDANGNGAVTDQELSAWFVKTEMDIALLDSSSFPDVVPSKKDKTKTKTKTNKEGAVGDAKKTKGRAKSKKGAAELKKSDGGGSDGLNSSMRDADTSIVEAEPRGGDARNTVAGAASSEGGSFAGQADDSTENAEDTGQDAIPAEFC
jgi:hypothetical protein